MQQEHTGLYKILRGLVVKLPRLKEIIERMEASGMDAQPFIYMIVFVFFIPFVLAIVLTSLQVFPATIAIHWIADEEGMFSLKMAMALNTCLFMIVAFVVALPFLIVRRIAFDKRKKN